MFLLLFSNFLSRSSVAIRPPNTAFSFKLLPLPDLNFGFAFLKRLLPRSPGGLAMGRGHSDENALLPNRNCPKPVDHRDSFQTVLLTYAFTYCAHGPQGELIVSRVLQLLDGLVIETVSRCP